MTRSRLSLALLLTLLATNVFAQNWKGMLHSTDEALRDGEYFHARRTTIKLINSMMDNLNTGDSAMYTMGLAVAYRAVAEAGLKNYDEADWYWHVAQNLYPNFASQFDLTRYGEAGAWVANLKNDPQHTGNANPPQVASLEQTAPENPVRQDPVCLNRRDPKYPVGAVINKVGEPITIRVVIDTDGNVHHPQLVSGATAPTLVYAASEAVKDWKFQPAMIDGKPASMPFDLTVNFRAPRE